MAYRSYTLHDAAGETGAGEAMDVSGHRAFSIQYLNTGTPSASLTFEGSLDGTNWDAIYLIDEAGDPANTAGAPGIYHSPEYLVLNFVRASMTYTSGEISVIGTSRP